MPNDFDPILEGKFLGVSLDNPNKIITSENVQHLDPHYLIYSYAESSFVEINPQDNTTQKVTSEEIGGQDYPDKLILSLLKLREIENEPRQSKNKENWEVGTYGYHLEHVPTLHLRALQLQAQIEGNHFEKAYPDPTNPDKIYIIDKNSKPDSKGVLKQNTGIREDGNTFLVNLGNGNIKRYDFCPYTFNAQYRGPASILDWNKSTRYVGIGDNGNQRIVIHSNDINDFIPETAIFDKKIGAMMYVDKETGRMMNAENDKKEANIEKLRKSFEAIQSDTLLKQDQYLALLTAAFAKFIDSNEPIQQQGRGTKGTGNPYEKE